MSADRLNGRVRAALATAVLSTLSGCAPQGLYSWGHYEQLIYDMYAKPGQADPTTQVALLTEDINRAHAAGKRVPPGVHAHLAYMQYQLGNQGVAEAELETEKTLFPESTVFVDGLLQRMKKR